MKGLVVLSGGMDSAVALSYAKQLCGEVKTVHFQYGSKHNQKELPAARAVSGFYGLSPLVVELPFVHEYFKSDLLLSGGEIPEGHYEDLSMKKTVVPFRNGIMLSIAAGIAESLGLDSLFLGNHAGDHAIYPDCRKEFSEAMGAAIRLGTYQPIELQTPFVGKTKSDLVTLGHELGTPFHRTWSCYKGGLVHCGKCGTCVERIEAFKLAGMSDPVEYEK